MATTYCRDHFTLPHRLIASLSGRLDNVTYTQRHGLIRGMKRRGGLGFLPPFLTRRADGTREAAFLSGLDLTEAVIYDVGAFEGVLTLFFSRQAAHVVAYEPNPPSRRRLEENLNLNGIQNVTVRDVAVGNCEGTITLISDRLMPGAASGDAAVGGQIARTSRRVDAAAAEILPLDEDVRRNGLPAPDLIKVDIEGMELSALEGMRQTLCRHAPALYLEMHGATAQDKEEKVRRIVGFLHDHSYSKILHVESGVLIDQGSTSLAREGHIYCWAATSRVGPGADR
jgi:FkbM family methyltransferase